jgi:tetratricopeptide (TPR) repeat protein
MAQTINKYYIYITIFSFCAVALVVGIRSSNRKSVEKLTSANTDQQETLQILKNLGVIQSKLKKNAEDPELNLQMANMLFDIQRYDEAIIYYRKTLLAQPDKISAQIDLSICFYNLQITDTAIIEMKKALNIDPVHIKGLFNIGVMYYNTGQIDDARHYWSKLLILYPESREADIARGIIKNLTI